MSRNDLARHFPILTAHWPEFPPQSTIRDLKLRRDVERLHSLPARVTFELLSEIGASRQILTLIEERTAAFAAVDSDALVVTGSDQFPMPPVHEVSS